MKVVAVKDHSVPFQVEIPLEVEKSVWARALTPSNNDTRTFFKRYPIADYFPELDLLIENERLTKFHPKQQLKYLFTRGVHTIPSKYPRDYEIKNSSKLPIHDDEIVKGHPACASCNLVTLHLCQFSPNHLICSLGLKRLPYPGTWRWRIQDSTVVRP
jgi:hypothetical protein